MQTLPCILPTLYSISICFAALHQELLTTIRPICWGLGFVLPDTVVATWSEPVLSSPAATVSDAQVTPMVSRGQDVSVVPHVVSLP